jgi:hypothetical protein
MATNRVGKRRTGERLPDPISAHADAVITIIGENFSDHTSWGAAIRLALIVPPKLSAQRTNTISLGDCLTWLERFTSSLAKGPRAVEFYRMLAVWEGSPNRGWFGTIIIDLSEASFSPEHLKVTIQSSKPEPSSLICVTACEGVIEASHIIGRFGLAYLTESPAT